MLQVKLCRPPITKHWLRCLVHLRTWTRMRPIGRICSSITDMWRTVTERHPHWSSLSLRRHRRNMASWCLLRLWCDGLKSKAAFSWILGQYLPSRVALCRAPSTSHRGMQVGDIQQSRRKWLIFFKPPSRLSALVTNLLLIVMPFAEAWQREVDSQMVLRRGCQLVLKCSLTAFFSWKVALRHGLPVSFHCANLKAKSGRSLSRDNGSLTMFKVQMRCSPGRSMASMVSGAWLDMQRWVALFICVQI
mmetsp:Transcript_115722/g.216618  ORF Transcript_115722/g.216618 Transcript_115722/m.216618 type:complete len:247 (-) Transcript_115722:485-1225(-)